MAQRLWTKYVLWDFHPLVFFYFLGMALVPAGLLFGLFLVGQQRARLVRASPWVAFATARTSSTVSKTRRALSSESWEGRNFGKLIVRVAA